MNWAAIGRKLPSGALRFRQTAFAILFFVVSVAVVSWPMIVNRQPFLLSDTITYLRGADAAVYKSVGAPTDWTERYHERFDRGTPIITRRNHGGHADNPVILSGRSIYYGAFLYAADRIAGLRLAALVQAVFAVICLLLTVTRFGQVSAVRAAPLLLLFAIVLSLGSSLAYFASYLVPDLSCALAIVAAAHLVAPRPGLAKWNTYFWFGVLSLCAPMSSATLLILVPVLIAAALIRLPCPNRISGRGLSLLAAGLLIGVAGEAVFYGAVLRQFGAPPVRPPFVVARLVADGPGRAYLQEHCPEAGFTLCRYLPSIASYNDSASSDSFLWSHDISKGVFSAVDSADRRRIAAEEVRFVRAVFEDRPMAVIKSSIAAVLQQVTKWHLGEFNMSRAAKQEFAEELPARVWAEQNNTLASRGRMPVQFTQAIALPLALLSLIVLFLRLRRSARESELTVFCCFLLVGIASDIVVCGVLSTPHDRYLMRVAWLIPMAALLAYSSPRHIRIGRRLSGSNKAAYHSATTCVGAGP